MRYRVELRNRLTNELADAKVVTGFPSLNTALDFVDHVEVLWTRRWTRIPCPWQWSIVGNVAGVDLVMFSPVPSHEESHDVA